MSDLTKFYKSGEAAEILGISQQTLRNWHNKGVLTPEQVYPSGHRRYSEKQLNDFIEKEELISK